MKNKEDIQQVLAYFRSTSAKPLNIDEDALHTAYSIDDDKQSLATKILAAFGAVLGCFAFIAFLLIAGLYESQIGLLIFGSLLIAGALTLDNGFRKIVLDTLSISAYIIGLVLIITGLSEFRVDEPNMAWLCMAIAFVTLCIVRGYMLAFFSVLIICGCILYLLIDAKQYDFIHLYVIGLAFLMTYLFLQEAKIITAKKSFARRYNPLRIGLIFSFIAGILFLSKQGLFPVSYEYIWISSIFIIAIILYFIGRIIPIFGLTNNGTKTIIYLLAALALLLTALSPAISGSLLLLLLCFYVNYKTGFIIGLIAFIYFMGQYYYDLNFTLLTKSILLFSSGILFLILYLFTHKHLKRDENI